MRPGVRAQTMLPLAVTRCARCPISAGKMSGLWSGNPNAIKLHDLDVFCAVLGCGVDELLIPEPETVAAPTPRGSEETAAAGGARPVTPRARTGRSLPAR